ncbi:MAG: hypothetical protein GWN01_10785, partial [Nitrosopumilaceae archaeon]|nr:hypothetical protein [Nitrosopumilaceae archaeon]NIX61977.1 hypothetical protein [Nitrosopumilaceae archaeon]
MEFDNEGLKYIPTSFIGLLPAKLNAELKHLNTMMADKDILLSTQKENTYAVQRKSQQILILQKQIERHLSEYIENLSREEKEINAHIMQLER